MLPIPRHSLSGYCLFELQRISSASESAAIPHLIPLISAVALPILSALDLVILLGRGVRAFCLAEDLTRYPEAFKAHLLALLSFLTFPYYCWHGTLPEVKGCNKIADPQKAMSNTEQSPTVQDNVLPAVNTNETPTREIDPPIAQPQIQPLPLVQMQFGNLIASVPRDAIASIPYFVSMNHFKERDQTLFDNFPKEFDPSAPLFFSYLQKTMPKAAEITPEAARATLEFALFLGDDRLVEWLDSLNLNIHFYMALLHNS